MTDTADYKSNKAGKACFANASIGNPWRQTGWITMNQQLKEMQDKGVIIILAVAAAGRAWSFGRRPSRTSPPAPPAHTAPSPTTARPGTETGEI